MFDTIGKFASRFRYPILIAWLLAVVLVTLLAPNLSDVTIAEQSSFLNPNSPSLAAAKIAEQYFPGQASSGSAVLVLHSNNGPLQDNPAAQAYLTDLTNWLKRLDPKVVHTVLSPADDPTLASRMISKDGLVAIISVGITGSMDDTAVNNTIKDMQKRLKDTPEGLEGYVTGGLAIAHDYKSGALSSAEKTTIITVVLVIAILLTIYRSPILPLVPLATIGIAYGISRGLVAYLATFGWTLSSFTDVFMVVLLFGAGTDYCLFIVSRFREYMADEIPATEAARTTIAKVGETITSSAGTVIVGTLAMSFVELKIFASSGPSLAIGVLITLLAGLTFTPALLAVLGRRAFWPGKPRHADTRALWGRLAGWVAAKPWLPLLIALAVLVPLGAYGLGFRSSFDMLADLPSSVPAKAGFNTLSDHFGSGEMQPLEVVTTNIPNARTPQGIAFINALTQQLLAEKGVADVRSLTLPAGKESADLVNALRVDQQLAMIADGIQGFGGLGSDPSGLATASNGSSLSSFGLLISYLAELGKAFPELISNPDYQSLTAALDRLQTSYLVILYQMPVKDQLGMLQSILTQALASSSGSTASGTQSLDQLTLLGDYLQGLGEALPTVASMDGYTHAMKALAEIESKVTELSQGMVVSAQLEMIAARFEETAKALETDPTAMQPEEGQPTAAEQMDALRAYLEELGVAYPDLKTIPDYTTALSTVTMMATAAESDTQGSTAQARLALNGLSQSFRNMAATAAAKMPEATFVPRTSLPGMDASTLMGSSLTDFSQALTQLQEMVAAQLPEATYIPNDMTLEQLQAGVAALQADMATLEGGLRNLAQTFAGRQDNFFVPLSLASGAEVEGLTQLLDTYTSAKGDAARLQIILADQPYSSAAIDTVARLRDTVEKADHGYIYSGTAVLYDLRDAMARDMRKVMLLTLSGIAVVMVLLLRSLVAPLYLMATILLSYGSTLGITRVVFEGFMGINLTWFVPLFIFTMLMSLGMDYNIFLMGRVKEETAQNGTRAGIQRAMERTGGIITSAGIIMAGTFAAMMVSSLVGLVQLAFAITVGVLLDTFVIRTTLVPAIGMLLGKWNWWPRRGKK